MTSALVCSSLHKLRHSREHTLHDRPCTSLSRKRKQHFRQVIHLVDSNLLSMLIFKNYTTELITFRGSLQKYTDDMPPDHGYMKTGFPKPSTIRNIYQRPAINKPLSSPKTKPLIKSKFLLIDRKT